MIAMGLGLAGAGCATQPDPVCAVARREAGYYAVAWTPVNAGTTCNLDLKTRVSMQKYSGAAGSTQRDVAIKPTSFNGASAPANSEPVPSGGASVATTAITMSQFKEVLPDSDLNGIPICTTADFSTPATFTDPTKHVGASYTFSNVRFLEGAKYLGSEFAADVAYTATNSDGSTCSANFHAVGIAPAVSCWRVDECGTPIDETDQPQYTYADKSKCDLGDTPTANPAYKGKSFQDNLCDQAYVQSVVYAGTDPQVTNYFTLGSKLATNIRSDYALKCDSSLATGPAAGRSSGYCIPASDFPSLR